MQVPSQEAHVTEESSLVQGAVARQCVTELFGSLSAVVSLPPIVNPKSA